MVWKTPYLDQVLNGIAASNLRFGFGVGNSGTYIKFGDYEQKIVTWQSVRDGRKSGLQIWMKLKSIRQLSKNFMDIRRNDVKLKQLLGFLYGEVYWDFHQSMLLLNCYYRAVAMFRKETIKINCDVISQFKLALLTGVGYHPFLDKIDSTFERAIFACYTEFCAATEPLLGWLDINRLISEYKRVMSCHYKTTKGILGYDKKENIKKNEHLVATGFYDRVLFYMFMQQSCVRNARSCINWGVVSAAASYGKGIRNPNAMSTMYFGTSTTLRTMLQKIHGYSSKLMSTAKIYYVIRDVFFV